MQKIHNKVRGVSTIGLVDACSSSIDNPHPHAQLFMSWIVDQAAGRGRRAVCLFGGCKKAFDIHNPNTQKWGVAINYPMMIEPGESLLIGVLCPEHFSLPPAELDAELKRHIEGMFVDARFLDSSLSGEAGSA